MTNQVPRIKLLIVTPTLHCGGAEKNVSLICNHIDTGKYEVTLAVLDHSEPFFLITNPGIKLIDLHQSHVRNALPGLIRLSKNIQPDIILATANHLNLLFAVFKFLFPGKCRIIARESSIASINSRHAKLPVLYNRLLKLFYHKLDFIVCQSGYMKSDLIKHYGVKEDKLAVIQNPVDPPAQADPVPGGNTLELITVARLSEEKGIQRLVNAVSHLKIPYRFTIIGSGPLAGKIKEQINALNLQSNIFLAGESPAPFAVVPGAMFFLSGSYYEGFPNAMLEALAAGVPVIAFHAPGGMEELLVPGENGLLVTDEDERSFAMAIEEASSISFNRAQIREKTMATFHIDAVMKKWDAVIENILDK